MISSKTFIAFTKFGIVGGISFLVDLSVYYGTDVFLPSYIAKAIGIIVATRSNYEFLSMWKKKKKKGSDIYEKQPSVLRNYLILYAISGSLNVLTNELLLSVLPDWILQLNVVFPNKLGDDEMINNTLLGAKQLFAVKIDKLFAVLTATMVGMMINFIGQKLWVFGKSKS